MACSSYVFNQTKNQYGTVTWTDKSQTESLFISLIDELIKTIDNIIPKYASLEKEKSLYLYELMIELHTFQINNMGLTKRAKAIRTNLIVDIHARIHAIDPSHAVPEKVNVPNSGSGKIPTGCLIYILIIAITSIIASCIILAEM